MMNDLFKAQHNEALAKIKSMVEKMGEDEFVKYYQDVDLKINRKQHPMPAEDVKRMMERTPKYMCVIMDALLYEFSREADYLSNISADIGDLKGESNE